MKTLVVIRCGERVCALDRAAVQEVAPVPELAHPPSLPASVEGLMNLGGEAIVVVDLAKLLDVSPNPDINPVYRHVVVLAGPEAPIALLVDRVEDVCHVAVDAVTPADDQSSVNGCVVGHVEIGGVTAHLLDASRIFLAAERARFAEIQRSEQARMDALDA
ncbi:MAG: chemotaxis protein CheW [Hyphomonadaceae bacterium]|nr:chemotaxis protein CheW [Hyphomonadaceae bacterium]